MVEQKIQKAIEVHIPLTPNFIIVGEGVNRSAMAIAKFTDEELEAIGKEWTKKLITKARNNRTNH